MPVSLPAPYRFTPLEVSQRREVFELDSLVFPGPISVDDALSSPDSFEWDRTWGIRSGEELAAIHGTYSLRRYPVPGGRIACGWLTWVGVHPGHRRRGLLRAMIAHHLQECRERGEVVSGLSAAEAGIYGRFGYGMAARHVELTVPRRAELRPVPGSSDLTISISDFTPEAHADLLSELHAASAEVGAGRPGWATWETPGLRASQMSITPAFSRGKEPLRVLLVHEGDRPVGYATFRREVSWSTGNPEGTVQVSDLAALTPAATHRLWSTLLDLDLTSEVKTPMLALDDPLLELLLDARRAQARMQDNTWLRIVDVPGALSARALAAPLDTVVEVRDKGIPANAGTWRIRGEAWQAPHVTRTSEPAGVRLDIRELSAAYLGGASISSMVLAGLVRCADDRAGRELSAALGWPIAPVVNWVF